MITTDYGIEGFAPTAQHTAQVTADMRRAAALPVGEAIGFMADYGDRAIGPIARQYAYPSTIFRALRRHADRAYEAACGSDET